MADSPGPIPFKRHQPSPAAVAKYGTHVLATPMEGLVVVSFPRSGRTWLRVLLDRLNLRLAYTHDDSGHQKRRSLADLETDKSAFAGHKVIHLIRDPRDVAVSGYFMASQRRDVFSGTLSEFLRDDRHGLRKILHFNHAWYASRHLPADFLLVRYERMQQNPFAVLKRILSFTGRQVTDEALRDAIDFCRFENMQRLERQGHFEKEYGILLAATGDNPDRFKTRRGKVGGYLDILSPKDVTYCDRVIHDSGYPLLSRVPGEA